MIFLGTTFLSGKNALYPPAAKEQAITAVTLKDGTYNQLYISKNADKTVNNWDDDWDFDTVMCAEYDKNLDAGNSGFSLRNTDTVVIRRRELLKDNWVTIYTKEINKIEDFDINILDKYARGGETKYIYRISSTLNGIENSYVEKQIISYFEGMYIADKNSIYGTSYDLDGCDTTQNIKSEVVETYNRYPTVVSNSDINYEKGSVTGSFIHLDCNNCSADLQGGRQYRQTFKERLASHKPFILKMPDGRMWIAKCIGNASDNMKNHPALRQITFEWVEIGNTDDMKALYYNGLSDVGARWWH
ncbi:MAG: hypothetical protein J6C33_05550 [Lachnospiraceae bacterium]|nr:hypothetical protein [Lachnospiraceae bacterium]